jgi:type II secretory pathway pseudopilin PulG
MMLRWRQVRAERRRGYLLLEVLVGGVMAASVLGLLMVTMVTARNMRVRSSRRATAGSLVAQLTEKARSLQYDSASDALTVNNITGGAGSPYTVTLKGSYDVTVAVAPGTEPSPTSETLNFKDVTITVSFVAPGGLLDDVVGATRIYRD